MSGFISTRSLFQPNNPLNLGTGPGDEALCCSRVFAHWGAGLPGYEIMHLLIRRGFMLAGAAALALTVAACGDNEPEQRKAFAAFLQTRIIDKQGIHVPSLTDEEKSSFGPYFDHYMVIGDFNREMNKVLSGPYKIAQTNAPRNMQELVARRADVKAMAEAMGHAGDDARKLLAEADAKRAALKQPDDLKPVYAAAYQRDVMAPAEAFLATIPVAVEGLNKSLELADYLESHRATLKINGASIQTADKKTNVEVNQLLNAVNAQNQKLTEARRAMQSVTEGR